MTGGAADIPLISGFTDGRPWLEADEPTWVFQPFSQHRRSIFDWETESDMRREETVIDKVELKQLSLDATGMHLEGEILGSHRVEVSEFA